VLILGCTGRYGFHERMQESLGVPVIDAVFARRVKVAEMLAETGGALGWYLEPGRRPARRRRSSS